MIQTDRACENCANVVESHFKVIKKERAKFGICERCGKAAKYLVTYERQGGQ